MAENKEQHYVPRAHLKPFTKDAAGAAIVLFHIPTSKIIPNAATRGQCSKPYFYGQDLVLEKAFQKPEGAYASVLSKLNANEPLHSEDFWILRMFWALQSFRTFGQVEKQIAMNAELREMVKEVPEMAFPDDSFENAVKQSVLSGISVVQERHLDGLRECILVNDSGVPFITSDDPAHHVNRYYLQRLNQDGYGFKSTGIILLLPLTPRHMFIAYDADCYTSSSRNGHTIKLEEARDVWALNQLQMLGARNAIFLPPSIDETRFLEKFNEIKNLRPKEWMYIYYYQEVGEGRYQRVAERPESKSYVHHIESVKVRPRTWPSILGFRSKIRTDKTGTAAGDVRPSYVGNV